MPPEKRSRDMFDENWPSSKDYAVCDQCRVKKIRCGRERPQCSNCIRLDKECEWSGNGKKPSQTVLLSHAVMGLGSRLQQLEGAICGIQGSLGRLDAGASTTSSLARSHSQATMSTTTLEQNYPSPPLTLPKSNKPHGRRHIVHGANGCERYFGPTSLASLMYDMNEFVLNPLCKASESPTATESVANARDKISLLASKEEQLDLIQDGSPPTSPPLAILEAMIEPYFNTINHYLPIWTKERFRQLVASSHESKDDIHNRAYVICSSNLILLTLATKSLRSRARNHAQPTTDRTTSSIDSDLTKSFLANAKRAIENIELLLSPRLINVQTLLSLCLVAQEHFTPGLFGLLFNLAAQVAKSIGLHHWDYLKGRLSPKETQEQQNVFYCLYILDKAVCWTTGWSPGIPISDVHIGPAPTYPGDEAAAHLIAKAKMARIEEQIYVDLYSKQSRAKTEEQVRQTAVNLGQKLQGWWTESGVSLEDAEDCDSFILCSRTELAIALHSARILLNWPAHEEPDACRRILDDARICIRLFLRLWNATSELGHYSTLARLIASYPPLGLCKLSEYAVTGQADDSDLELLQFFVDMLQTITESSEASSYNAQLCKFAKIMVELANTSKGQRSWRQFKSPASLRRITPDIRTPSSPSRGTIPAQVPKPNQSIDGFLGSDVGDSPALFTSIDPDEGFFNEYLANELAPPLEGFEKNYYAYLDFPALNELLETNLSSLAEKDQEWL